MTPAIYNISQTLSLLLHGRKYKNHHFLNSGRASQDTRTLHHWSFFDDMVEPKSSWGLSPTLCHVCGWPEFPSRCSDVLISKEPSTLGHVISQKHPNSPAFPRLYNTRQSNRVVIALGRAVHAHCCLFKIAVAVFLYTEICIGGYIVNTLFFCFI